ncbi:hypothetical protein [Streptomyces millisiae]|uniref:Uncharacterized protein n=1 Tax=Streptomyces millisiae TaxID=3075542 RepID=A0ABU2LLR5_9ACTN|nr:hypothetical protein [Streptomyces sp. DSM 44918]MDT0318536.1 hypothetical protein [Streptomyces sp. DSM 44918]
MSDRLEWAEADSPAELLYPGTDIDGATVSPGEMAVAVWTGSNGIALYGPQKQLADRLGQLAHAVRCAPPAGEREACIDRALDPQSPRTEAADSDAYLTARETKCGFTSTVVMDPRQATCSECIEIWNSDPAVTDESRVRLTHPLPMPAPSEPRDAAD